MAITQEIRPGLHVIEVPLPGSPLKSINSYVIRGDFRNLVIDTGMRRPECDEAIRRGLDELGVDLANTDFFITHLHADHIGLVSDLAADASLVYFNHPDAELLGGFARDADGAFGRLTAEATRSGFTDEEIEEALERHPGFKYSPPEYPAFRFLSDGDRLDAGAYQFNVVATPGHTPGHLCLYEPHHRILISGDHVLGDITPNITIWRKDDDSLGDYLQSLDKVAELKVDLVLPGHRRSFTDCAGRIDELKRHHQERLDEVQEILGKRSATAYEVASKMTWDIVAESWARFPIVQKWFAVSEATSHLRYLERRGVITGLERDGVIGFSRH